MTPTFPRVYVHVLVVALVVAFGLRLLWHGVRRIRGHRL